VGIFHYRNEGQKTPVAKKENILFEI
jgi:hypothetical protein